MGTERATSSFVAIADPPEIQKANPIHAAGATAYGYDRPIVAGLSSYGWAAAAIIELFGEAWLDRGWASFSLPRPVFEGDTLRTEAVRDSGDREACTFTQTNEAGKATVVGQAGVGVAPFHGEWVLPANRVPAPPAQQRPLLMPEQVPIDVDYPAMAVELSVDAARQWAGGRLGDHHSRYHDGPNPRAHPSWVPGQMTPLIRHSYRFAAGIHTTGRVQHLAPLRAPQVVVVAGRWIGAEIRKGRQWSTSDAVFLGADGTELAYCQQSQILLPPLP